MSVEGDGYMKMWLCLIEGNARISTFVEGEARFGGSYNLPLKVKKVKPAATSGRLHFFKCYIAEYP